MTNRFTQLLDVEHPIVQAPIGGAATAALCAAVSNAGGLGTLAMTWRDLEGIDAVLCETKALTDKPFGVNLILREDQQERLARCLEYRPAVVSLFWGDPAPYIAAIHAAGSLAAFTVGSADEAKRAVDLGVDLIVAQGWEAGGHVWGQVATMALVPAVSDAIGGEVPLLAAGGIVDGRGLAAALALGADGVWMGTRFLLAEEAFIHPRYRERLIASDAADTVYTKLFDIGWPDAPHRVLENETLRRWRDAGSPPSGSRPGEGETVAHYVNGDPIPRYAVGMAGGAVEGDADAMAMYAGQGVGALKRVQPAAEIVAEVVAEAGEIFRRDAHPA